MKITIATAFFLCAFVVFVKANNLASLGEETGDLEDELNELETMEIQDALMGPPKPPVNLDYAFEAFLKCFMEKNKGRMDKKCIQEFKKLLPADMPRPRKGGLIRCAVRSFKNCNKKPKHHEALDCMRHFNDCVENGEEGSGY
ncbi:uncharacterized protein LOC110065271 [Orbicella faveolata]|uniref:uncharacterized protein LOC110065271 n=1 Tax=Orbicella faveolata TaxID=48498 RepID=UPI0009E4161C|nr:uncharacterized protein LOC110065271 [Orbicella faveolata]